MYFKKAYSPVITWILVFTTCVGPSSFGSSSDNFDRLAVQQRVEKAAAEARVELAHIRTQIEEVDREIEVARKCYDDRACEELALKKVLLKLQRLFRPVAASLRQELTVPLCEQALLGPLRGGHIIRRLASATARNTRAALSVLNLREFRHDPTVFFDFWKNFATVFTFQMLGFVASAVTTPGYLDNAPYFVFVNTFIMMLLQSEVGARHTERLTELPKPADLDELYAQIPAMIAGEKGFAKEFWDRLTNFAKLWPVEWIVINAVNTAQKLVQHGLTGLDQQSLLEMISLNSKFITGFGVYLSVRWSLWDKIVNLRFLPAAAELQRLDYLTHGSKDRHAYWRYLRGRVAEMGYRYGVSFIDAYIVFKILGGG